MGKRSQEVDLQQIFEYLNTQFFEGVLEFPKVTWNSRLRSSAGRFIPGSKKPSTRAGLLRHFWAQMSNSSGHGGEGRGVRLPTIEVASYLLEEEGSSDLIQDTLAHEMIHYWLWTRGQPYGHTPEFYLKMREIGCSRWNPVPRVRPYRYEYSCPSCLKVFPARKKLGKLACLECCKRHSDGRYDPRFRLELRGPITK
jgi:predicted SprT family Zn-dependent metalloprotease